MKKEAVFKKGAVFDRSKIFHNIRGDLAVYKLNKPYKFCYDCCLMIEASKPKLFKHYRGHHTGKQVKWLGYNEVPVRCIYSNFEYFLQ